MRFLMVIMTVTWKTLTGRGSNSLLLVQVVYDTDDSSNMDTHIDGDDVTSLLLLLLLGLLLLPLLLLPVSYCY
jgi:hypothetical protein